jgi:hypothetical protein
MRLRKRDASSFRCRRTPALPTSMVYLTIIKGTKQKAAN